MFKFRSGNRELNEELSRHKGREVKKSAYCVMMNVSVSHVL